MNRQILNQVKMLQLGGLARVEWFDASVEKSRQAGGAIDVPVKSWGICLGVFGEKNKQKHLSHTLSSHFGVAGKKP